jgi:hypothetical protein
MSDHIADRAAFVAALTKDDPERASAEEHARSCTACQAARDEGMRLVTMLEEALPLPPPTAEALARAAQAIELETSNERRSRRWVKWAIGAGVVGSWAFQIACGIGLPMDLAPATVVVSVGVVALSIAMVLLLRRQRELAVGALIATSGLLVYVAQSVPGLEPGFGIHCTLYELTAAAIPWVVAIVAARRAGIALSRWNLSAVAAGGALASQAAQHITCPVHHADAHLLVFHLGGVMLAALLGAVGSVRAPKLSLSH